MTSKGEAMIQRWVAWLIGVGIIMVVVAAVTSSLLFPALPASVPEPTAAVTPNALISNVAAEALVPLPALGDVTADITLALSGEWKITSLQTAQLDQTLAGLRQSNVNMVADAALTLQTALSAETNILAAMLRSEPNATLTVMTVKRNGLSLERYLEEVNAGIKLNGATVQEAKIDGAWRADGLPTAALYYSLPVATVGGQDTAFAGLQVVALNRSATDFVIFTLMTPSDRLADLEPRFAEILHTAKF